MDLKKPQHVQKKSEIRSPGVPPAPAKQPPNAENSDQIPLIKEANEPQLVQKNTESETGGPHAK